MEIATRSPHSQPCQFVLMYLLYMEMAHLLCCFRCWHEMAARPHFFLPNRAMANSFYTQLGASKCRAKTFPNALRWHSVCLCTLRTFVSCSHGQGHVNVVPIWPAIIIPYLWIIHWISRGTDTAEKIRKVKENKVKCLYYPLFKNVAICFIKNPKPSYIMIVRGIVK